VITIIEHLIGKGRTVKIYDRTSSSTRSTVAISASCLSVASIGRLLMRSLDELILSSDTLVIAQKPSAEALGLLTASGLPILDLTRLAMKQRSELAALG